MHECEPCVSMSVCVCVWRPTPRDAKRQQQQSLTATSAVAVAAATAGQRDARLELWERPQRLSLSRSRSRLNTQSRAAANVGRRRQTRPSRSLKHAKKTQQQQQQQHETRPKWANNCAIATAATTTTATLVTTRAKIWFHFFLSFFLSLQVGVVLSRLSDCISDLVTWWFSDLLTVIYLRHSQHDKFTYWQLGTCANVSPKHSIRCNLFPFADWSLNLNAIYLLSCSNYIREQWREILKSTNTTLPLSIDTITHWYHFYLRTVLQDYLICYFHNS